MVPIPWIAVGDPAQILRPIDIARSGRSKKRSTVACILRPSDEPSSASDRADHRPDADLPADLDDVGPSAAHVLEPYVNNVIEADHGRVKVRPRPIRGLKRMRSARTTTTGHAVGQNNRHETWSAPDSDKLAFGI
jgi:DDE superfamily endonuclease